MCNHCLTTKSYDEQLLYYLHKATKRPNARILRRQERTLEKKVQKEFKVQLRWLLPRALAIVEREQQNNKSIINGRSVKDFDDEIDSLFSNLDDEAMISAILLQDGKSMLTGGKFRVKNNNLAKLGIDFNLSNPLAIEYIKGSRPLVLAKMTATTKAHIKPLLVRAVETGQSPQDLAALITENYAFSPVRSMMISVNEVGNAYEEGNLIPMKDAKSLGHDTIKAWSTVNDERVTPSHTVNQDQGWIDVDDTFEGTGDERAPASDNPRCRCTTLYEIKS